MMKITSNGTKIDEIKPNRAILKRKKNARSGLRLRRNGMRRGNDRISISRICPQAYCACPREEKIKLKENANGRTQTNGDFCYNARWGVVRTHPFSLQVSEFEAEFRIRHV